MKTKWTCKVNKYGDYEIREGFDLIAVTESTSRAHVIATAPEAAELARQILSCVAHGKPWRDCDHADLIESLESFEGMARAIVAKARTKRAAK